MHFNLSTKYQNRLFVWLAGSWALLWESLLCMAFTRSPKKVEDRLTKLKTSFTAPSVVLCGVWRLLGSSMPATKDMEVREHLNTTLFGRICMSIWNHQNRCNGNTLYETMDLTCSTLVSINYFSNCSLTSYVALCDRLIWRENCPKAGDWIPSLNFKGTISRCICSKLPKFYGIAT